MKRLILVLMIFTVVLAGCGTAEVSIEQPTAEPAADSPTAVVEEVEEPTEEPTYEDGVVYTTDNEGPGSLRNAVMEAQPGDVITFDPEVFPVDNPSVIKVSSPGPIGINQGEITIDASNAGVILDGEGGPEVGLIVESSGNKVMGLKFEHFSESGLIVKGQNWDSPSDAAADNIIGGDSSIGDGPYGQGNCFVNNGTGLYVQQGADHNTVTGNFIGVEADGTPAGNPNGGIVVQAGADDNVIGPNNVIANTDDFAVMIEGSERNTITQNSIYNYGSEPIKLVNGGNREWLSFIQPESVDINCQAGTVSAEIYPTALEVMEVFSGDGSGPQYYEGSLSLNTEDPGDGSESHVPFTFEKETAFTGSALYFVGTTRDNETTTFTGAVPCGDSVDEMQSDDPFFIINTWLDDWQAVFGENVDAMKDNEGGQFGPGSMKVYNEEENVFTFSEMDGSIWTPLNTLLDEFDGVETGGNQAIMIKFQPSVANALQFTFMGPNEFGVEFWDDGHPSTFFFVEAYKEGFGDGFALEAGLWYNMLMAIDKDGKFLAVVWEDGNFENHAIYQEDLASRDMGDGYKNVSWKFIIGSNGALTLNVEEYNVFRFGGFKE